MPKTTPATTSISELRSNPRKQTTLFVGSILGGITDTTLLNNVKVPALEDGCANKKLLIKADEKTCVLDAYASTRPLDPGAVQTSKAAINTLIADINRVTTDELTEGKRGLVISEISQFREHAMKWEREKMRELQTQILTPGGAPSGPKMREWGQPKRWSRSGAGMGKGAQGYNKPVVFVREWEGEREPKRQMQTDEELEAECKEGRRHNEEDNRANGAKSCAAESDVRSSVRLEAWDDDESDKLFYIDRAR
ncbi:hypothetical protein B0H14DRAFT_2588171 [Mycena olivaceomarginata]|nr:hypothetical protein B0H14DRAFT_2588171 [Mycena olivaceomarginata]